MSEGIAGLRRVVVVGAGIAGLRAAETLRRERFDGEIVLLGEEAYPAYDRPALSKDVVSSDADPRGTLLRPMEKYGDLQIDLCLGHAATGLDLDARRVLVGADSIPYDGLIIATGVAARRLGGWGHAPHDPLALRGIDDAIAIRERLAGARHLTVIGAGFIGSELAAGARSRGIEVTVLELERTPLARSLGPEMADAIMDLHRGNGTDLRLGVTVAGVAAPGTLRLTDDSRLQTDLVIAGVGVTPNTAWLEGSGLTLDNGVVVDESLAAGPPGVYAVGDIANWPNPLFGRRMRVEHWTNASQQATAAARNLMRGTTTPFSGANYVWSDQYGVRIQLAGVTTGADVEVVAGSIRDHDGLAWYRTGDRLVGALAIGRPAQGLLSSSLISSGASWSEALEKLDAISRTSPLPT
ncbi:NAD(P)/FAD-dependent oxidoreductase [Microbacterium sp. zg.B48]|uniref:NAD(P)/FAD-dependent oxidoreductase n=1 Tax=Microbacterium sp. zg.B48 TaxID=2969408 RepID=UPI00214C1BAF|nr:FAD/NAD(P)-binding oxidoreductase [Microbacterium sp. zg.B48]MCR2764344.1 NAD(P)/FAD-dependent oxidoreductase [Microbacterium sp. zg.B48]